MALYFLNIREDRARQLTESLINPNFNQFPVKKIKFRWIITGIQYEPDFNLEVLYKKPIVQKTFLDIFRKK